MKDLKTKEDLGLRRSMQSTRFCYTEKKGVLMKIAIKRTLLMMLMVMMVVTLVPGVGWEGKAYTASSDPLQQVTVGYVDSDGWGNDVWLSSSKPYYVNGATEATSDSTVNWNAYYDVSTGTLTYRNYDGNGVDVRSGSGWLKIVLIGNNKIHCKGVF